MDEEENVNTEKAMAINLLCGFAELSLIKTLFVWEGWWSVDITSSKRRSIIENLINAFEMH